jgi:hypothetical protein
MSQPSQQPAQPPVQPTSKPPIVRLPTWVNVVLVLILFASCSAANDDGPYVDGGSVANEVVNRLQSQDGSGPGGPASAAEVEDLCRLLGAVAAKQKVPLTVMNPDQLTRCREVAQEAATAPPKPTATP